MWCVVCTFSLFWCGFLLWVIWLPCTVQKTCSLDAVICLYCPSFACVFYGKPASHLVFLLVQSLIFCASCRSALDKGLWKPDGLNHYTILISLLNFLQHHHKFQLGVKWETLYKAYFMRILSLIWCESVCTLPLVCVCVPCAALGWLCG